MCITFIILIYHRYDGRGQTLGKEFANFFNSLRSLFLFFFFSHVFWKESKIKLLAKKHGMMLVLGTLLFYFLFISLFLFIIYFIFLGTLFFNKKLDMKNFSIKNREKNSNHNSKEIYIYIYIYISI